MAIGVVPISAARFDPERAFQPRSIVLTGSKTPSGQTLLANIRAAGFTGSLSVDTAAHADIAFVADPVDGVPARLAELGRAGTRGAIVISPVSDLKGLAAASGMRCLGPHSFGLAVPALGLNATLLHEPPPAGKVALIAQSATLARTVLDWAIPNGLGFSLIGGVGGNADLGFGLLLDHVARHPGTSAILLEVDRLRDPRAFLSAARAAARLRPVVALAPGGRLRDPSGVAFAGYRAALSRAGVLLVETLGEFLAAAETLPRSKPARGETIAVLTNSLGAGRLAADHAIATGIGLATLTPETRKIASLVLGHEPPAAGPIAIRGDAGTKLADLAALLCPAPEIGGILVVHAPSGAAADAAAMEALIAAAKTVKVPLLIAVMGEASALAHRRRLAEAGLPVFETPSDAVGAFRQLVENRRNRAAARELPSSAVLEVAPDQSGARARLSAARELGHNVVAQDQALGVFAAYGIAVIASRRATNPEEAGRVAAELGFPAVVKLSHPNLPTHRVPGSVALDLPDEETVRVAARAILARLARRDIPIPADEAAFIVQHQAPRVEMLRIRVADDPILGPTIGLGPGGGDPDDVTDLAIDLPPLNLPLARALIARSAVAARLAAHRGAPAADIDAVAETLVRISQMVIDFPKIASLDLDPLFALPRGVLAGSGRIELRAPDALRPPLVIAPYPSELIEHITAKGETYTLRPIRPEDAEAHAEMFRHLTPEDVRYRFFSAIRELSPEQTARMTNIDYGREMAIIAVHDATAETAGVARLVRNDTDGREAEFAVLVEPAAKGRGLATALMKRIIAWGASAGVEEIVGQILSDNAPMIAFIKTLGFAVARVPGEEDIVEARYSVSK